MPTIKLSEKYKTEREEICKKMLDIVGNEFLLCELEDNAEKLEAIRKLIPEIQKYYAVSAVSVFRTDVSTVKRDFLILVRFIAKEHGYQFNKERYVLRGENGYIKNTIKYMIQNI